MNEYHVTDSAQIQSVLEHSVEGWNTFIEEGLGSSFYRTARDIIEPHSAADITLLKHYLDTFFPEDRERLEQDVEFFYRIAMGFIQELSPFRVGGSSYEPVCRAVFLGKIRSLLREERDEKGHIKNPDHYLFLESTIRMCCSLNRIIGAWDRYREFMFRIYPQLGPGRDSLN